jgi:hypothetical protein
LCIFISVKFNALRPVNTSSFTLDTDHNKKEERKKKKKEKEKRRTSTAEQEEEDNSSCKEFS